MKKVFILLFMVIILMSCNQEENANTTNIEEKETPIVTNGTEETMKLEFNEPLAIYVWQNKDGSKEDTMVIRFYKDVAPGHVENFIKLTAKGMYNGNLIFRVEPGFVVQTGSPTNENTGGPGYMIDAEFNEIKHLRGTLAMARAQDPNSAGSQYYFTFKATPMLDNKYTVFGQIIENVDLLEQIKIGDFVKEIRIVEASEYYGEKYKEILEEKDIH